MKKRRLKPVVKVCLSVMLLGIVVGGTIPLFKTAGIFQSVEAMDKNVKEKKDILYLTTSNVNLRVGASLKDKVIEVIPNSKKVTLITTSGSWSKVQFNKKTGWVKSSLLKAEAKNSNSLHPQKSVRYEAPTSKIKSAKYVEGVLIVNKKFGLPSTYNPGVNPLAQKAVNDMTAKAQQEGITIKTISAFRSYAYQDQLFKRYSKRSGVKNAERYSAHPGQSEHQTGLAFDFGGANQSHWLETSFGKTAEGKWLEKNAHLYGFVLRYHQNKESITGYMYEPWHFRYVGTEMATKLKASGLTMEEYFHIDKNKKKKGMDS